MGFCAAQRRMGPLPWCRARQINATPPDAVQVVTRRGIGKHDPKGMLWFWLLVFLCTRPGLCFFCLFLSPVGAAFPPCRGFVSGFFAFILSLAAHLPPFTTQRRASAESPPRKSGYGLRTGAPFGSRLPIPRRVTQALPQALRRPTPASRSHRPATPSPAIAKARTNNPKRTMLTQGHCAPRRTCSSTAYEAAWAQKKASSSPPQPTLVSALWFHETDQGRPWTRVVASRSRSVGKNQQAARECRSPSAPRLHNPAGRNPQLRQLDASASSELM